MLWIELLKVYVSHNCYGKMQLEMHLTILISVHILTYFRFKLLYVWQIMHIP